MINNQLWHQNIPGMADTAESQDFFGRSVAAGDFNGDGRDDLTVGIDFESIGNIRQAGAVHVLYGSISGLTATNNQFWHQDIPGVEDTTEDGNLFGNTVAAGDFNGDGRDDLAIGVLSENFANLGIVGAVNVLYGSSSGLIANNDQIWHQDISGVRGFNEFKDRFGDSISTGDFNGDGRDDLAIGVPEEDIGNLSRAGAVNVLYGSSTGLTTTNNQLWSQDSSGIAGIAEESDIFGRSVATGDFNGDGRDDLAIGVPGEDIGNIQNAGVVNVLYGSSSGLTATNNQLWSQNSFGVLDNAETNDGFGRSLTTGDFNGDGRDDLAIGVSGEDISGQSNTGAVNVIYGSDNGLNANNANNDQFFHQDLPGVADIAQSEDSFGSSLTVGDFNLDGFDDLAVGIENERIDNIFGAGAVQIFYGSADGLTI